MKTFLKRASLLLSIVILAACSQEPSDQPSTTTQPSANPENSSKQETQEKAKDFDLEDVKRFYSGVPFSVSDISERPYDGGTALAITFSVPINPAEPFSEYITVEGPKGTIDGSWVLSDSGKIAYYENIRPLTTYKLTIDWNLRSALGDKLPSEEKKEIKTRNVVSSVGFSSSGSFIPLNAKAGLPVTTVNVNEIDIAFHKVNDNAITDMVKLLGQRQQQRQYYLDKMADNSKLIFSGRFNLPAEANKRRNFNIPLDHISELNEPGLYVAVMNRPGTYESRIPATYFMITDLGIHIRKYANQIDVFINSLQSAKAMEGVKVSLLNREGALIKQGLTNDLGSVTYQTIPNKAHYILAQYRESLSLLPIRGPALDLSEFNTGKRLFKPNEFFIYSERDLYRPGDTINFVGLLRNFDGETIVTPRLKAKIRQPNGQVAKNLTLTPTNESSYSYSYQIAQDAQVGEWSLIVESINKTKEVYKFKVEEFLPERLKIQFDPEGRVSELISATNPLSFPINSQYLYGAPASGNRIDTQVIINLETSPFEQYKDYQFGNIKETQWNEVLKKSNQKLDSDGNFDLTIKNKWNDIQSPLALNVFANVYESGGRSIRRGKKYILLPRKGIIGIQPAFNDFAPTNGLAKFTLVKTDSSLEKLPAKDVEIQLIRRDRRYFWEYSAHEGWHYEYTEKEYPELTATVSIDAGATQEIKLPVEYGSYRLEIKDPTTNYTSSLEFNAGRNWYSRWYNSKNADQAAKPDRVTLALDNESYRLGDTAKLKIIPPDAGESLVLVESDHALWKKRFSIPKQGKEVEIPIDEDWNRHDIYISVLHIQPTDFAEKITPTRSMGLIHLPIDRSHRKLDIDIKAPDKWLPNTTASVELDISQGNNQPSKDVWVTLSAVDVGILNITDFETPNPHEFFYGQRRYDVDSLDVYNDVVELNNDPFAEQRWGGDAATVSRGGKHTQSEVQIVSIFSGVVPVVDGKASIELALPDFNGRIKLMAVAFSDHSFGSSEEEVTIAAPVVTQLSMPRFLAHGDRSSIALDLNNLSGSAQDLDVEFDISASLNADKTQYNLSLNDNEKKTLFIPIEVTEPAQQAVIGMTIKGIDGYSIDRDWKINLRSAYPAITHKTPFSIAPDATFNHTNAELESLVPETVQSSVSLSNKIDLGLRSQLQGLLRYPYGCLEQSTSSTYPWVYFDETALDKLNIENPTDKSASAHIESGMDRIFKKQKTNGSFGLWSSSDPTEEHWLTAYVADFLSDAKARGFLVPEKPYKDAMTRLEYYLKSSSSYGARWSSQPKHYRFAYRAYSAYVLSRHKQANLGQLRQLMKNAKNSYSPLPLFHLGLALHNQGDAKNAQEMFDKAYSESDRSGGYLGDYGSSIRDLALIVHLIEQNDIQKSRLTHYAQDLNQRIRNKRYLSTQERNALFRAALSLERLSKDEWNANISFAGVIETVSQTEQRTFYAEASSALKPITIVNNSKSDLYGTVINSGYGKTAPDPVKEKGISLERQYYNENGEKIDPSELNVGDLILVSIKVETEQRMPDLLLVDLLPAGLELENQNLKHSTNMSTLRVDGKAVSKHISETDIRHQEYRDDRYVAALNIDWRKQARIFYLARAVTPGEYKVPPSFAEDMYKPENFGISETIDRISIRQ